MSYLKQQKFIILPSQEKEKLIDEMGVPFFNIVDA